MCHRHSDHAPPRSIRIYTAGGWITTYSAAAGDHADRHPCYVANAYEIPGRGAGLFLAAAAANPKFFSYALFPRVR